MENASRLFRKFDDIDSSINNANTKRMIARCKINIGLRDDDKYSIETAKKMLENLNKKINEISIHSLRNEILDDLKIIKGIEEKKVVTHLEFIIPFPLKLQGDNIIEFIYNEVNCKISTHSITSPLCPFESNGFIRMLEDKHGIANHSEVKLSINKYIEPRNPDVISELTSETAFKPLRWAIEAINYFIDHYKVATNEYWIPRITHKMITKFQCKILSNEKQLFNSPYSGNGVYSTLPKEDMLDDDEFNRLQSHLKKKELNLWELLLANTKDFILVKSYREAIITLNSAFENYMKEQVPSLLRSVWSNDKIKSYMSGKITYDEFFLKDYINQDDFDDAVNKGIIKEFSPSPYHMIKTCCKECKLIAKKKRYNYLVSKIRKGRNDVVHGRDYICAETNIVESLHAFEKFIDEFQLEGK